MTQKAVIALPMIGLLATLVYPTDVLAAGNREGEALYQTVCRACHAPENVMVSSPKAGDVAAWERRLRKGLDQVTENAMNGFGAMPARGGCVSCTVEELRAATNFMAAPIPVVPE